MVVTLTNARRRRLLSLGPEDAVRVYTFQAREAWDAALRRGHLAGDPDRIDPDYAPAYAWMARRMRERVDGYSGDPPVWAYLARPNMRRRHWEPDPRVLVVAEVPRRRTLLSDMDRWHLVLDRCHVTDTEGGIEALEAAGLQGWTGPREATPAMEASWEAIFDLDGEAWPRDKAAYWGMPNAVQACVDRIRLDEVVRVTEARGRVGRRGGVLA